MQKEQFDRTSPDTYRLRLMPLQITKSVLLAYCLLITFMANAQSININNASSMLKGDMYSLSAIIDFDFDEEVLNALEHGVDLNIDVIIMIKRERNWLWDPKVKEDIIKFKLEHHPLSKHYLITNLATENRYERQSIDDALKTLGTIKNYFLISRNVLKDNEKYICMVKAELNIETLPPAIQPVAFVSKKWQLESPWYEWELDKQ